MYVLKEYPSALEHKILPTPPCNTRFPSLKEKEMMMMVYDVEEWKNLRRERSISVTKILCHQLFFIVYKIKFLQLQFLLQRIYPAAFI